MQQQSDNSKHQYEQLRDRNARNFRDWYDKWRLHQIGLRQDRNLFHVEHRPRIES